MDTLDLASNWAEDKSTDIAHLIRLPAFSKMDLDVGGYRNAPNAISSTHGPSWRMIVELDESPKAWGVYPGGQSGNPGSPFYDSSVETWKDGDYFELFFMKAPKDSRKPILFDMELGNGK